MDEEERKLEVGARIAAASDGYIESMFDKPARNASVTGDGKVILRK